MQHVTMRNFNVAEAARHSQRLQLSLAEPFFADLEQTEVDGGEVEACIDVKHISQDLYHIDVSLKGSVTVACDRCLDPLTLPVEVEETLRVKDEAPAASDHEDTLYTDYRTGCIDLAWLLYELIETALPMQRTHPIEECNPDMLSRLASEA